MNPGGEVAERSKAADSKSVVPLVGTGGSNPSLSASFVFYAAVAPRVPPGGMVNRDGWALRDDGAVNPVRSGRKQRQPCPSGAAGSRAIPGDHPPRFHTTGG